MTITLKDVGSGFKRTAINENFDTIEAELNDNVLRRDTATGNQMEANIDMNSNRLMNLVDAINGREPVTLDQLNGAMAAAGSGLIAAQRELQTGAQVVAGVTTFTGITYALRSNNLYVFRNGNYQTKGVDYEETSASSITWIVTPNSSDNFAFITNLATTNSTAYTSAITHAEGSTAYNLATYLQNRYTETVSDLAGLEVALTTHDVVALKAGEYPEYVLSVSGKTLVFHEGVTFKLSDNSSTGSTTEALAAFEVTGDNNTLVGSFSVSGNAANNVSTATSTSDLKGAFSVNGDNCNIHGDVTVTDAYWVGYSLGDDDTGVASNFNHNGTVRVIDADHYQVAAWSCSDWTIDKIVCEKATQSTSNRIYTGNQSASTKFCQGGVIGAIHAPNTYCVFEIHTSNLDIGTVYCSGGKTEEANDVTIKSFTSIGLTLDANAFTNNASSNIDITSLAVVEYDGLQEEVVQLSGSSTNVSIGTINVRGTLERVSNPRNDVVIYGGDNLHIGNIFSSGSSSVNGIGVLYNPVTTVNNIVIDNIVSEGHSGNDVNLNATTEELTIKKVNSDATVNQTYLENVGVYSEETATVVMAPQTSGTITLSDQSLSVTKQGRLVTVTGTIKASSVSSPTGSLRITGLPHSAYATGKARQSAVSVFCTGLAATFAGVVQGRITAGSDYIELWRVVDENFFDLAQHIQANTEITMSTTYAVR